ncbi:4-(cytidine 5'-diphospho)-2-C-methyl-D-erythritol kinase [Celeribacter arenosi]|uniref:4-diphosphocytidyl-2-C-methyl-D-erythritol kinase n=1 Tax=Celeribacter arenosi TaxID=792649 RepID=A0ABP7K1Y3_9RHOB
MTVKVFAPAKINLALHVTGQRADGYHLLDSLVAFVDVGDQIAASPASQAQSTLAVTGPFADGVPTGADNLVLKAAGLTGIPMDLTLDKRLPPASGIGGGSADAAATLRAAVRLGGKMPDDILSLGADVPVCVSARSARMRGIGDDISPVTLPALHMVLLNPRVPVSTPDVFSALSLKQNAPMEDELPNWPDGLSLADWLAGQRNDLQSAAVKAAPEIAAALTVLALAPGALMVRMSGSGATCFALFETRYKADFAAQQLADSNPWWWIKSASTLP